MKYEIFSEFAYFRLGRDEASWIEIDKPMEIRIKAYVNLIPELEKEVLITNSKERYLGALYENIWYEEDEDEEQEQYYWLRGGSYQESIKEFNYWQYLPLLPG